MRGVYDCGLSSPAVSDTGDLRHHDMHNIVRAYKGASMHGIIAFPIEMANSPPRQSCIGGSGPS